jgi:hypothetical protein
MDLLLLEETIARRTSPRCGVLAGERILASTDSTIILDRR